MSRPSHELPTRLRADPASADTLALPDPDHRTPDMRAHRLRPRVATRGQPAALRDARSAACVCVDSGQAVGVPLLGRGYGQFSAAGLLEQMLA
jgi:hypothetical protein